MATLKVTRSDLYPAGTKVKAYLRTAFHDGSVIEGVPPGEKAAEAEMKAEASETFAELTGLVAGTNYVIYASVSSKDVYLVQQCPPAAATNPITGIALPSTQKLLGQTFDPVLASSTFALTTAGVLYGAKVFLPEASKISKIVMWMTTKGGTLTALECGLGVFSEGTRAVIAEANVKPSTLITAWEGATGEVSLALEKSCNVPAGLVYVCMYYNGTTKPTFATAPSSPAVNVGLVSTGPALRNFSADTALTVALPATINATQVVIPTALWIGVV